MRVLTKICVVVSAVMLMCMPARKAEAQVVESIKHAYDTIRYSFKVRPRKFVFNFDNRRTFSNGSPVRLNGIRIGAEYNNIVTKFIGFYGLREPIVNRRVVNPYTPQQDTVLDYFDFRYTSIGIDYTFYETKKWQFSTPIQVGLGSGDRDVRELDTLTIISSQSKGFFPLEIGVSGLYRFYDWVGVGAGIGYRTNLGSFFSLSAFEGVYYSFGLKVFLGQLYRKIIPKKEDRASILSYPLPRELQHASQ